ncbi:MAG: hypothetical protein R3F49_01635 [Planctomycetota bacterium]
MPTYSVSPSATRLEGRQLRLAHRDDHGGGEARAEVLAAGLTLTAAGAPAALSDSDLVPARLQRRDEARAVDRDAAARARKEQELPRDRRALRVHERGAERRGPADVEDELRWLDGDPDGSDLLPARRRGSERGEQEQGQRREGTLGGQREAHGVPRV